MEPYTVIEIVYNPGDAKLRNLLGKINNAQLNRIFKNSFAPLDEVNKKSIQISLQTGMVWKEKMYIKIYLGFSPVNRVDSFEKIRNAFSKLFEGFLDKKNIIFISQTI